MLRKLPILLCMLALIISFSLDYTTKRDINLTLTPLQSDKNTAIYAGYSEDGTISDYVITYLKKLKKIAPNIVFVTDNQMSKRDLNKIRPYVNHIIAYRHGEYDWGSYKRGYNWLMSQNLPRHPSEPNGEVKGSSDYLNNDSTLAHPQENLKPNTDSSPSTVILEAMRQHQHIGDPQTSALAHNNDNTLAHPQEDLKPNTDNSSSTVILEAMRQHQHIGDPQTSALAHNNDSTLAHPQEDLKPNTEGVATGGIKYDAGSEFATAVYKKGYIKEQIHNHDHALAHPHPPLLILANDSTITLADSFAPLLADMQQKQADVYGITANQDGTYHIQSYFIILNNKSYRDKNFANYLNNVKKEKDGLTVAYRYEVPFTQYMQSLGYKTATYIPYESLSHLPLNDKNCYPLTLISQYNMPVLKMRTFTNRLTVQEPRRLVFSWLKKHKNQAYKELIKHLKKINSPYLSENK